MTLRITGMNVNANKILFRSLLLTIMLSVSVCIYAQEHWGQWQQVSCLKGLYFRLSKGDASGGNMYSWRCQFKNEYSTAANFSFVILAPGEVQAYKNHTWQATRLGQNGRVRLAAGEDQSAAPKDRLGVGAWTSGIYASNTILYIVINDVRWGVDDINKPFAADECGRSTDGRNSKEPTTGYK